MKKKIALMITAACALALSLALVGCGGGNAADGEGGADSAAAAGDAKSAYEEQTFEFDEWQVTITNDEVVYDENNECYDLVLYLTATNNKDRENAFSDRANMQCSQDGERLSLGQYTDENGEFLYDFEVWQTKLKTGESIDLIYPIGLISDSPVKVVFSGFSSDIADVELEFEVADRMTK